MSWLRTGAIYALIFGSIQYPAPVFRTICCAGIQAASGSACTTGMPEPSHVLTAMGIPHDLGLGALRLSLGRYTIEADIETVLEVLPGVIEKIRTLNPAYELAV